MRDIGVDLHKRDFQCCYVTEDQTEFKKFSLSRLEVFKKGFRQSDRVAIESTGNSRWFMNQVKDFVAAVVVVNPFQFKVIVESSKKTDKGDAELLAFYLSKGMLPEVVMKDEYSSQIKSLCNTRDKLVKLRTALKNKIHNILLTHGIVSKREDFSSEKGLKKAQSYALGEVAEVEIDVIVGQIRHLNEGIAKLDREIESNGKRLKGYKNITSIKGIGPKSGTILLSVIGDIDRFGSQKALDSYFGIVPRVRNSSDKINHGHITKQGSKLGRTTLVQCTLVAIRYSPYLRKFYLRLKNKKGSGKAIIATSRKLLGIIYQTLKNDWIFEDFPNFVLKTE
jgi:transposase